MFSRALSFAAVALVAATTATAQTVPPTPAAAAEAIQQCSDFTFALRTQREQLSDAAASMHATATQQSRTIAQLQQENAQIKSELERLRAGAAAMPPAAKAN
jgi:hypothetical protein